ncbi:uncharacterized protein [Henckelia pumila]|uniref:uncharacterized protein n=1 Tax=Henckelia pumila TaxID=405737 RepID=UPI003C6E68B1
MAMEASDAANPYFLSHSHSPELVLVSQPLTGDNNYAWWSRAMVIALSARNKIGFIDGTIVKPSDADVALIQSWIHNNNIVISWLLNSVSKEICDSIIFSAQSAMEIWADLKERFQQHDGPRIFQLRCQLFSLRQNQDTVCAYFAKLKSLWEELNNYYGGRGKCSCGVNWQMEYIMAFLMGLNESFAHVRRQVILMDPLPAINKVFSLIYQAERLQNIVIPSSVKTFNFDASKCDDVHQHHRSENNNDGDVGALRDFFQNLRPGQCQRLLSLLTTQLASSSSKV